MKNILVSLRRITKNKNTVTIIGVIIILVLLYWGYSKQVNDSVRPVTMPIAATTIQPRTEITDDMVETIEVPRIMVFNNVITSRALVVGKYSNVNALIPQGSLFYADALINEKDLPDSAFVEVKEGDIPYAFRVDIDTTYGNSIYPGNKIDIWMKAEDADGKVMVGKLIENVEVIAVKDRSGRHVFENTEEAGDPATLTFGLEPAIYVLVKKAEYMSNLGVELFPVPHGRSAEIEDEELTTQVSTVQLQDYINANSVRIEGQDKTSVDDDTKSALKQDKTKTTN